MSGSGETSRSPRLSIRHRVARFLGLKTPCEARGHHSTRVERRAGYRYPSKFSNGVADSVSQVRRVCRHCGAETHAWANTDVRPIHSLSMPRDQWDALRENGELWS